MRVHGLTLTFLKLNTILTPLSQSGLPKYLGNAPTIALLLRTITTIVESWIKSRLNQTLVDNIGLLNL